MILSSLLTVVFLGLVFHLRKHGHLQNIPGYRKSVQMALRKPRDPSSVRMLSALVLMLVLPLFWGLTFFLETDANVIVVIGTLVWIYNWIKYLLPSGEAEED